MKPGPGLRNIVLLLLLPAVFMWKVFLLDQVAFPGDLLVGAYYPWFENIPVKNPLISDVFSQIFSWKYLITQSYLHGQTPLWNQYSFSGYPLLANFHSGALYPLNTLFLPDFITGWNLMLYSQLALAGLGMYFFLRHKFTYRGSIIAAAGFAFSGFALTMWQVGYSGHTMAWLAFALLVIKRRRFWLWPFFFFLGVTAGHFQAAVYFLSVSTAYYFFLNRNFRPALTWAGVVLAGILLTGAQVLPTLELARRSVRFEEGYIKEQNFGLLPLYHLAAFIVPDFFGNPATHNYWGTANYQETVFYPGIIGALALLTALISFTGLSRTEKFFTVLALASLVLGFDTPLGKLIYWLKVPAVSTSSASRVFMLLPFASSVLTAGFVSRFSQLNLRPFIIIIASVALIIPPGFTAPWQDHAIQVARNLVLPALLISAVILARILPKSKWAWVLLGLIVIGDLFRFGWKYNPFTDRRLVFPPSAQTDFLTGQPGFFRVDRENGPVLPPNTWEMYSLRSASGYDPVSLRDYAQAYHRNLNNIPDSSASRYTELSRYLPDRLGEYGVKYLLFRKEFLKNLDLKSWKEVFSAGKTVILENLSFKGLAYINSSGPGDRAEPVSWENREITIRAGASQARDLTVATNYYPGWQATINGQPAPITKTSANFIRISLPPGDSRITLKYRPASFLLGMILSVFGAVIAAFGLLRPQLVKLLSQPA